MMRQGTFWAYNLRPPESERKKERKKERKRKERKKLACWFEMLDQTIPEVRPTSGLNSNMNQKFLLLFKLV